MQRRVWLSGTLSVVLGAMLIALGPGRPAAAAGIPTLDIFPAERRASVPAPDGTSVTFILRRADGGLKERKTVLADEGRASVRFDSRLRPGDRLTVKSGGARRTLTVLPLTLVVPDRVTDLLSGKGANRRTVRLTVHQCVLGLGFSTACDVALRRSVTVSGGRYRLDTTGDLNIRGFQVVAALMRSSAGDRYRAQRTVPLMSVSLHQPFVSVAGVPACSSRSAILRGQPGGAIIGVASLDSGGCAGQLALGGSGAVDVEPGNQLTVDFAADARMKVPGMIEGVELVKDSVGATCFAGQPYRLQVFSGSGRDGGAFEGIAGENGEIFLDTSDHPTEPPVDLVEGHDMRLSCVTNKGDAIRHDHTVPS